MKKKDSDKSFILNVFIFFIILIMIGFIIFYHQVREYQKEIQEKERTIEIYKKEDKKDDKTSENYAKKLNQAKEEIKKVKKETNYKGFNKLSTKEQNKQLDKYNEGSSKYDDLVLISKNIKENRNIEKPRIVQGDNGIGKVEVPKGMLDKIDKEKVIEGIQGNNKDLNSSEQDIVESVNNTPTTPTEPTQSNPVLNQLQNEPIAPSQGNNQVEAPTVTSEEQPQVPQVQPEIQQPVIPEVSQEKPESSPIIPQPDVSEQPVEQPIIPNTPIEPQVPVEEPTVPQGNTGNQTIPESFVPVEPQQPIEEDDDAPYRKPDVPLEPSNKEQEQPMVPLEPAIPNEDIPMVPLEPAIPNEDETTDEDNTEENQKDEIEEPTEEQVEQTEEESTEQSQEEPIEEEE